MPANSKLPLVQAREILRAANLRCTTGRIAVVQTLHDARAPLSNNEVVDELAPAGYDKSTLYRCLVELADAGLLNRLDLGDHIWRFEFRAAGEHQEDSGDHPHFMCVDCGKVTCLPDVNFSITPVKGKKSSLGAFGDVTEVLLKGHCAACR